MTELCSRENTVLEKEQKSRRFPLSLSSPLASKKKPDSTQMKSDPKAAKVKTLAIRQVSAPANKAPAPKSKQISVPAGNTQSVGGHGASVQYSTSPHHSSVTTATQDTRPKHRMSAAELEKQRRELLGDARRLSDNKVLPFFHNSISDTGF